MKGRLTLLGLMMATSLMAQGVLDLHSHLITPEYRALLEKHGAQLDEGYPLPEWSETDHLMAMNTIGIASSVITMPAPHPYFGDIEETKGSSIARVFFSVLLYPFQMSMRPFKRQSMRSILSMPMV